MSVLYTISFFVKIDGVEEDKSVVALNPSVVLITQVVLGKVLSTVCNEAHKLIRSTYLTC